MIGAQFAAARQYSRIPAAVVADLLDIAPRRLASIEAGTVEPEPAEVDRAARLFGVRVRELIAGEARRAPMSLLFKSMYGDEGFSPRDPEVTRVFPAMGDFLRAVRDAAELESVLGRLRPPLPEVPPRRRGGAQAMESAALAVRNAVGLGLEPIPSMRKLLEDTLDVFVFFTTSEVLSPTVDGASTQVPRPAILVNLAYDRDCWWRIRMTLAHELGHLLLHRGRARAVFSPRPTRGHRVPARWRLYEGFVGIESEADAFAACLLAPAQAVRDAVANADPTSEEAIGIIGSTFGVGRTVAINRLQHVCGVSRADRFRMETRPAQRFAASFDDQALPHEVGLRSGIVRSLALRALHQGRIGRVRAWEAMGLALGQPLEDVFSAADRAPPLSAEARIAGHVTRFLLDSDRPDVHVFGVAREDDGWVVEIGRAMAGDRTARPTEALRVSDRGQVLETRSLA